MHRGRGQDQDRASYPRLPALPTGDRPERCLPVAARGLPFSPCPSQCLVLGPFGHRLSQAIRQMPALVPLPPDPPILGPSSPSLSARPGRLWLWPGRGLCWRCGQLQDGRAGFRGGCSGRVPSKAEAMDAAPGCIPTLGFSVHFSGKTNSSSQIKSWQEFSFFPPLSQEQIILPQKDQKIKTLKQY